MQTFYSRVFSLMLFCLVSVGATAQTLVINEVDADTPGTDVQEFIEIYDGGVGNTSLDGYSIVLFNGSDDKSYNDAFDLDGYSTDENGYFVIGNVDVPNVTLVASSNFLQNGADAVALVIGDAVDYPNDTPVDSATYVVDALVYGTGDGDDTVLIGALTPGQPQIDENANGDQSNHSSARAADGEGGPLVTSAYVAQLPTPGTANYVEEAVVTTVSFVATSGTAAEGDASFTTSVMIENADDTVATSFDIVLVSGDAADITSYTQSVTFAAGGATETTFQVTINDDADVEGPETFVFEIQNVTGGTDAVAGDNASFELTVQDNDLTLETLEAVAVLDTAGFPVRNGEQVYTSATVASSNPVSFTLQGETRGIAFYQQALVYTTAEYAMTGDDTYNNYGYYDDAAGEFNGEQVDNILEAKIAFVLDSTYSTATNNKIYNVFFQMYESGAVHDKNFAAYKTDAGWEIVRHELGATLDVVAEIGQYNGQLQFTNLVSVTVSETAAAPAPEVVTDVNESTESRLIKLENVSVDSASWQTYGSGNNLTITLDGGAQTTLRIDNDSPLYGMTYEELFGDITEGITIVGIGAQYDGSSPYTEGYQIMPYAVEDITVPLSNLPHETLEAVAVLDTAGFPVRNGDLVYTSATVASSNPVSFTLQGDVRGIAFYQQALVYTEAEYAMTGDDTYNNLSAYDDVAGEFNGEQVDNILEAKIAFVLDSTFSSATNNKIYNVFFQMYESGAVQDKNFAAYKTDAGWEIVRHELGATLEVIAEIGQYNGQLQFTNLITVSVSETAAAPAPEVVTAVNESTESRLIKLENVSVDSASWQSYSSGNNLTITLDGGAQTTLRIDNDSPLYGMTYEELFGDVTEGITIVGVGSQYDGSAPYTEGYQIMPYALEDITVPAPVVELGEVTYVEDFNDCNPAGWLAYSVSSEKNWNCTTNAADETQSAYQMNGYQQAETSEDWLITPQMDIASDASSVMSFMAYSKYGENALELMISEDYDGESAPSTATWTNLNADFPEVNSDTWKEVLVDLEAYSGKAVYIAYKYYADMETAPSRWIIDHAQFSGAEPVAEENVAPVVNGTIADQTIVQGQAFGFTYAKGLFTDENIGDELTITAGLEDGSDLPAWLTFDAASRTFSGTPTDAGSITVKLTATDLGGMTASVTFVIDVVEPIVISSFPYTQNFDDCNPLGWNAYSVSSSKNWGCTNFGFEESTGYEMNGYQQDETSEDWLILPLMDLTTMESAELSFLAKTKYGSNTLELFVSADYDGSSAPSTATWTSLSASNMPANTTESMEEWAEVTADLTAFAGEKVYVAFKYYSETDPARWTIDNVEVNATESTNGGDGEEVLAATDDIEVTVSMFPVPAGDQLNIAVKGSKIEAVYFFDLSGKLVTSEVFASPAAKASLNTATMSNGMYLVRVVTNEGVYTEKISKK